MINFFRKMRKVLANENKFQKYFRYAFGEVVLIMLGIFMALQLQNWNEKRKQQQNFNLTLEQIYNALHYDAQRFNTKAAMYQQHIDTINKLMKYPNVKPLHMLPFEFFHINFTDINDYTSDVVFHIENLSLSEDNIGQNELFKQITNYAKEINLELNFDHRSNFNELFNKLSIPWPNFIDDKMSNGLNFQDSTYYLTINLDQLDKFRHGPDYLPMLQKVKFANIVYQSSSFSRYKYAESLIRQIITYYPEAKLVFTNVGIIGTSLDGFDNVGGTSTPMTLTDANNNFWEVTLYLKQGHVKFRCNDSWFQNWGAEDFPKGTGSQDGPDIPIEEAGNYHITFNPVNGVYEFIKLKD
jgi:hypothetical protein